MSGEVQVVPLSMLIAIYADGFVTGVASGLSTLTNMPTAAVDRFAEDLAERVLADPLLREQVKGEIRERLAGVDSGPKSMRVLGNDEGESGT